MTKDGMDLTGLSAQADDCDFLRQLIGHAAQRLLDLEVQGATGAGYGERSAERQRHRNG